jgi:hypothetical protein
MFKHIAGGHWFVPSTVGSKGNTVWTQDPQGGSMIVADCSSRATPIATQRAHAKLIALAPDMLLVLEDIAKRGYDDQARKNVKFLIERMSHD